MQRHDRFEAQANGEPVERTVDQAGMKERALVQFHDDDGVRHSVPAVTAASTGICSYDARTSIWIAACAGTIAEAFEVSPYRPEMAPLSR